MRIYLDATVFYQTYAPHENSRTEDWIMDDLIPEFGGLTSQWTLLEVARALKKQVNLELLLESDARKLMDVLLVDMLEMQSADILLLEPISLADIINSRQLIDELNLYAADALHYHTARSRKATVLVSHDAHLLRHSTQQLPILCPKTTNFETEITRLLHRNQASAQE